MRKNKRIGHEYTELIVVVAEAKGEREQFSLFPTLQVERAKKTKIYGIRETCVAEPEKRDFVCKPALLRVLNYSKSESKRNDSILV